MKKILVGFSCAWLMIVSPASSSDTTQADLAQLVNSARHNDAVAVEKLIQRSVLLREKVPPFVAEADKVIKARNGAVSSSISATIAGSIHEADSIRTSLFPYALRYRHILYRTDGSIDDRDRIESILISMAAALTLYDNASFMEKHIGDKKAIREKLNEAYPEYGVEENFYKDSLMRSNAIAYRPTMLDAIRFFEDNRKSIAYYVANGDKSIRTLYEYIDRSPMRVTLGGDNAFKEIADQVSALVSRTVELPFSAVDKLKFNFSKGLGNTMGMVRWRSGKLRNDKEFLKEFSTNLKPGDILLEKTPFALTDKTIPGHFGHAAIYIGTYEQLRELGALNTPFVRKHLDQIREGKVILEALREGVVLNSVEHFMNIDDVAVLRPNRLEADAMRTSLDLAMSHFGKKYDFDFNVNTTETIVCSELVYAAYPQIDFMTKKVLTSFTISPDDIAILASGDSNAPLELTFFAHDGKKVYVKGAKADGAKLYRTLVGIETKYR
ncbi:MAG: YiiX/YebB-like N1pC/P60 family cysteine hydrolase [Sulfuricurvum sp.]|uniref:YiiX/YebB-like N1pC/P60 family cysteine hydrolase n=1 Tax=Sulfuricurvum sp. TaxID=2025608 RepID=UPI00262D8834|nr:YiiX/YebB-like N1pC/P60 family cysteine hydrolase [Sulfuricurvum sp.]MDD2830103.1 YiiX/YebB-like N1pC/P60 family cysteine hydrolase [Sulfuricurvum sp.]MDD4949938.1 YiiX/YebB-like N1pC/P60 family cysteine hydrolase [Sulfuricurvum sp.]